MGSNSIARTCVWPGCERRTRDTSNRCHRHKGRSIPKPCAVRGCEAMVKLAGSLMCWRHKDSARRSGRSQSSYLRWKNDRGGVISPPDPAWHEGRIAVGPTRFYAMQDAPMFRSHILAAEAEARRGMDRAVAAGHEMGELEPDADLGTWISYCVLCDGFMVVDLIESEKAYGQTQQGDCPGRPVHGPAPRRSESELPARHAPEPKPGEPVNHTLIAQYKRLSGGSEFNGSILSDGDI